MASGHLPDPSWSESESLCVACGYSLEGLTVPGVCPECGAPYVARQLVLAGVPRAATKISGLRSFAWAGVLVGGIAIVYGWPILLRFGWEIPLACAGAVACGLAALLATSKRERAALERFVVTPAGIQRLPFSFDAGSTRLDPLFVPWCGSGTGGMEGLRADCVEFRRISAVWRRLRIGRTGKRGHLTAPIFDAGVRCPDESAQQVEEMIREAMGLATHNAPGERADQPRG